MSAELQEFVTFARAEISCSFCRRGRHQVVRMVVVCGQAAICGECLGDALALLRVEVAQKPAEIMPKIIPGSVNCSTGGGHAPPLTGRDGFTGNMCEACGNFRMVRTGTCETCLDCGNAGGCG